MHSKSDPFSGEAFPGDRDLPLLSQRDQRDQGDQGDQRNQRSQRSQLDVIMTHELKQFMQSLEPDEEMILIVVSSLFLSEYSDGDKQEGAQGLIACSARKCPEWLMDHYRKYEISIEETTQEQYREMQKLLKDGNAIKVPWTVTKYMNVKNTLTHDFVDEPEESEDNNNEEDKNKQDERPIAKRVKTESNDANEETAIVVD